MGNKSLRDCYGDAMIDIADKTLFYVVDMDVAGGTGLSEFVEKYGDRVIQCGIAEQAGMGISAGVSVATGLPVVFNSFAVFGLRAFEIARLSVAFSMSNVKIVLSHVGLDAGEDGASAQSLSHYQVWSSLPDIEVVHPVDGYDMRMAVEYMLNVKHPVVLFTGRTPSGDLYNNNAAPYVSGVSDVLMSCDNPDIVFVASGAIAYNALHAALRLVNENGVRVEVVNARFVKPFDDGIVDKYKDVSIIVTVEDGFIDDGLYSTITSKLYEQGGTAKVVPVGMVDSFGESGSREELYRMYGMDVDSIYNKVIGAIS